jgi:hypothetical protein
MLYQLAMSVKAGKDRPYSGLCCVSRPDALVSILGARHLVSALHLWLSSYRANPTRRRATCWGESPTGFRDELCTITLRACGNHGQACDGLKPTAQGCEVR